jgi:hypothetical protein
MRKQQDKQGRQGRRQQGQQSDNRPEQGRDPQRNKQSDNRPEQGRDPQRNKQSDSGRSVQQAGDRSGASGAARQQGQEGSGRQQGQESEARRQGHQNVYGEGNYAASKQYNDATRDFVKSGRVEEAARAAEPRSDADALQMQAAEAEGKRHAKGEDPALNRKSSGLAPDTPRAPKPGEEE